MDPLYYYELPESAIAQKPASPRDSSKLLIFDTRSNAVHFDHFYNLAKYLPKDSFLVMNETKVLPARLFAQKDGQALELLVLPTEVDYKLGTLKAIANRRLRNGEKIILNAKHTLEVIEDTEKAFTFRADFDLHKLPELLARLGKTPIPNYIQNSPLTETQLRKKYQTVFAKNPGSVAAPTASLHFTDRVFHQLDQAGIPHFFVNLHVGLGTFAPVLPEHLASKTLYEEHYAIAPKVAEKILALKKQGHLCTAVGTTTTRTLETFTRDPLTQVHKTNLFILPPFQFKVIDQLLTNFHIPGSSLMMLVEAFLQHKGARRHLKEIYEIALREGFRFYSFGDSMLIV